MSLRTPWLSIIVPIYNAEKYLSKTLQSIKTQTFKDYRVILVDDGSTDSSSIICKEFASHDKRFNYYHIENGGSWHARLYGMKYIETPYFTFCDADDYYMNDKVFQFLYNTIVNFEDDLSVVQYGNRKQYNHLYQSVRQVKRALYIDGSQFYAQEFPKLICGRWENWHLRSGLWDKIYSSKLLSNIEIWDSEDRIFFADDTLLNLYLLKKIEGALFLPDVLYVYRQLSGGTSRFNGHAMDDVNKVKMHQLKFVNDYESEVADKMKRIIYSDCAGWFYSYLKDEAYKSLTIDELKILIQHTLALPSFIEARAYFTEHPDIGFEAANLLRQSDINEYVQALIRYDKRNKKCTKEIISKYALEVYKRL